MPQNKLKQKRTQEMSEQTTTNSTAIGEGATAGTNGIAIGAGAKAERGTLAFGSAERGTLAFGSAESPLSLIDLGNGKAGLPVTVNGKHYYLVFCSALPECK
jgi:hypothetical protein